MQITFPDQTKKEFDKNTTGYDIALSIAEGLARNAVAVSINGTLADISRPVTEDAEIRIITLKDAEGLEIYRHSSAHIMALAVKRLYPDVLLGFGPAIEDGFYYDFDNVELKQADLEKIEAEMKKIMNEKIVFERHVISLKEAKKLFKDDPYKMQQIAKLGESEQLSCYKLGDLIDLCRGPHVPHSGFLKAFKLLRIAGAYWLGDSNNKMLSRVYATSFPSKKELDDYLEMRRQAEERDHNKVGRELDLFMTDKNVGQGLPLLTPKGSTIKIILQRFIEDEEIRRGYLYTITPLLAKSDLYKISGHWEHYRDGMFILEGDNAEDLYALRPMTCPFQYSLYNRTKHSYRDMPVRYAETSTLFRNESSGEMHGLIRVRQFTLADGHIICRPDQLEEEFNSVLDLINYVATTLGLKNLTYRFSKWDPNDKKKYIDNPEAWESSQKILKAILDKSGLEYYEADGEAAFYGPKLDIQFKNVWGKEDTIITVQIDFASAERFKMRYTDADGTEKTPMIIHRSSIGCYERTIATLIEQYAGKFPFWLSPEQIRLLTINEELGSYAETVALKIRNAGLRVAVDKRGETLGKKVLDAQHEYIPVIVTIGNKEKEEGTVSVRTLDGKVVQGMQLDEFIKKCEELNKTRNLETVF
ncbi:MAG: threonine--tRNA ligase [Spirochaetales bacterium]|nr:threonine--tRNA ligase [Spirochaetales bacterium]